MKHFFLYLDESGNFESDKDYRDNPSLVGGFLSATSVSDEKALEILGVQYVHGCEIPPNEYGGFAADRLMKMGKLGWEMIIFENRDRIEVVDGDTTYLNVISEGIIQLLQLLQAEYSEVHLNITAAVRKAVNREDYRNRHIIDKTEYLKRLEEKIIIGLARKSIVSIGKANWSLELGTAREDHRLMLADIVCHSWFRKNRKFSEAQKTAIAGLFNEKYSFSVFSSESDSRIQRMILDGDIGDTIYEIFTDDSERLARKYLDLALTKLTELNDYSREIQLQTAYNKTMNLGYLDTNYDFILQVITRLKEDLIPRLQTNKIITATFAMDIYLLSLTIATHKGAIQSAEEDIKFCEELLPQLVSKWESLDYYFIYKIRRAVHLINIYDMSMCIAEMDELENLIENTFSLFPIADGLANICAEMKSDIRGKVVGTRLQARYTYVRHDPIQLKVARQDSDAAIKEFTRKSDIQRQYQYRCRLEYEAGFYDESLRWLFRSLEADDGHEYDQLLHRIIDSDKVSASYSLMHYISIIAAARLDGENELAQNMYYSWEKVKMNKYLAGVHDDNHPFEIIYWKLATYLVKQGSIKAAVNNYNSAIKISNLSKENQTLKAIALGIKAEMISNLMSLPGYTKRDQKQHFSDFLDSWFAFMNLEMPLQMKRHFFSWKAIIIDLKESGGKYSAKDLFDLSRQIIY